MKIKRIEREISHKIMVSRFESILPTLRMEADLDEGEDPADALEELDAVLQPLWVKEALEEVRMVRRRRNGSDVSDDKTIELGKGLKEMVK